MNQATRKLMEQAAKEIHTLVSIPVAHNVQVEPMLVKASPDGTQCALLAGVPKEHWMAAALSAVEGDDYTPFIAIVSEAWMVRSSKDNWEKDSAIAPSQHPDRVESVVIGFNTRDGESVVATADINRTDNTLSDFKWFGFGDGEEVSVKLVANARS